MGNNCYEHYEKICDELDSIMRMYKEDAKDAKKLKGALVAELLKKLIDDYLFKNCIQYKVSNVNSYIAGSKYEYDMLIVNKNAKPFMGRVYTPEDVISVVECKTSGLYNIPKDTDNIASAVNRAIELKADIKFGYFTIWENVPVNDYNLKGRPTINQWDKTKKLLKKKINGVFAVYAATLRKGKKICYKSSDEEFYNFIDELVLNNKKGSL